jgi:single-strand DNA-binding protein
MNRVILIGHLGKDVETKHTQGGQQLISFNLATTQKWKDDKGQRQERTEWHRCTGWGDRWGGVTPYLVKGTKVAVEGDIRYRTVEKDGKNVVYTDIHVNHIELLTSKREGGDQQQSRGMGPSGSDRDRGASQQKQMEFDDDIPF